MWLGMVRCSSVECYSSGKFKNFKSFENRDLAHRRPRLDHGSIRRDAAPLLGSAGSAVRREQQ
jgi:hypothetical protein